MKLSIIKNIKLPKTAFVVFNYGAFGGAPKRFTILFNYLNNRYPGNFYYVTNSHLFKQIDEVFGQQDDSNIRIIDSVNPELLVSKNAILENTRYYADNIPDPLEVDKNTYFPRKIYWYFKNKSRQKRLFRKIEKIRKDLNIEVFVGVFGGGLPLVFYLNQSPRKAAVIFSDMDSWFSDVHSNTKKMWYRKYYSFNYILENADAVDFLGPYVYEGIKDRGISIPDNRVFISPCSFIDYSKCSTAAKTEFEIAFASRLEPNKNPLLFLRAAKIINEEHPEVKFHLLGEGSLAYEIENFLRENKLTEKVNFRFHKNPPEIFKNTSVFVSLQNGTNYPSQSILEAMACENAIVASNTGDTNLIINQNNGVLIDVDLDNLVSSLKKFILNRDLTRNLGRNAKKMVMGNHTIERFTDYYANLLQKVHKNFNLQH